jgi:hypothetical protein
MAKNKQRICLGCYQPFSGRADAKTCSPKCRQRFQRARALYRDLLLADEQKIGYKRPSQVLTDNWRGPYARR